MNREDGDSVYNFGGVSRLKSPECSDFFVTRELGSLHGLR